MSGASGPAGGAGAPRGRGRGRARSTEPVGEVGQPPGAGGDSAAEYPGYVGRRSTGRRTTAGSAVSSPTVIEKPARGSPPSEHSPKSDEAEKMAAVSLVSRLACRPGYGTLGRKYRMFTNHFEIHLSNPLMSLYRYHITIGRTDLPAPEGDEKPFKFNMPKSRTIFLKCLIDNQKDLQLDDLYKVAYDGDQICFTVDQLNVPHNGERTFTLPAPSNVIGGNRPVEVSVTIQSLGTVVVDFTKVSTSSLFHRNSTPIQIIDIILKQYRTNPYSECAGMFYPSAGSFYMVPGTPNAPGGVDLGGGREIWKGLFASAHVAEGFKGYFNMDVTHGAFYKLSANGSGNGNNHYTVIQFMCDVFNEIEGQGQKLYLPADLTPQAFLKDTQRKIFEREIKSLQIRYVRPATEKNNGCDVKSKVKGCQKSAVDCRFTFEDRQISVAEYFLQQFGITLRCPKMPVLQTGTRVKPIYLPIEFCYLERVQKVKKKLLENQTSTMIRQTCMAPADRKVSIQRMVNAARFNEDPYLRNFGIKVDHNMTRVEGRILPIPTVNYANNQTVQPRDGVWKCTANKFYIPARASGVAAITFGRPPRDIQKFLVNLMDMCLKYGMRVPHGTQIYHYNETDQTKDRVINAIHHVLTKMEHQKVKCDLIIVPIPEHGHPLYAEVKKISEIERGVMTQCVLYKTVDRLSPESISNLALKINMKLGGVNCSLTAREQGAKYLLDVSTLVLGVDVTHPGPTERKKPSVAGVVGSMDFRQMRYAASVKVQKHRKEMIIYLIDEIMARILAFYKATEVKPERIIVFRDGVSQGQFEQVLRQELPDIRDACRKLDPNYRPKITFVVVQKRHHTRLFPENPMEGVGKAKNVAPGTVVDRTIVHSEEFVFYLCSHFGIQGTSRPTRYYVLHDESGFSADDMQMMTYYLCHCFSRCTRSVSIPAPVYYADLVCTRARDHLKASFGDYLSDSTSSFGDDEGFESAPTVSPSEESLIKATTVIESMKKEMYFT